MTGKVSAPLQKGSDGPDPGLGVLSEVGETASVTGVGVDPGTGVSVEITG